MTKCELCGKEFMRRSPTQKFCCRECYEEFKSRQRPPGKRRFSGRSYKNSEQRLNEIREKYKNGITADILREFAENLQIPRDFTKVKIGVVGRTDEEMAKEYEEKADCVEIDKDINVPIKWHDLRKNPADLPETSGEMHAERKPVLAFTKSLGWTQAIRRQVGKRKFEWVCSCYDGNTLFSDDEITAWTELPEPTMEEGKHEVFRNISIEENA